MDNEVVRIDTGAVRGVVNGDHVLYQGIAYAAPPRGELRWAAPRRPAPWSGVLDATRPGSPCPQVGSSYSEVKVSEEECLFLNVTTPAARPPTRREPGGRVSGRPVMVWLHGDGAIGAGHYFDAARLAVRGDVVVVTINYRLGVFGGFGLPGLAGSGTFGLQDQRAALEWVRRNAAAFGGDPGNVTLFGVSYGATSVAAHLVAPESEGLFHRAIMHSAFTLIDLPAEAWYPGLDALPWLAWRHRSEIEALGQGVAAELGCADVACLRALPAAKILEHPHVMNLFQSFGYDTPPPELLAQGKFARVPVLSGATKDEHRNLVDIFRGEVAAEDYPRLLAAAFGDRADEVAAEYPLGDYATPALAWAQVLTDRMWARGTYRQHQLLSAHTTAYAFEFADPGATGQGATHSSDIPYLFPAAGEHRPLGEQMIRYWTAFARTGDPNTAGLPAWPTFGEGHVQSLAPDRIGPVDYAAEHRLPFWDRVTGRP
ncbi:carboxylesterase family protein [Actinosynnema sp. NPDC047251]|uniref:carboxylesterase/lipase family protein n=1 Tax=Saccharothrix espanaensis TaxID=103731 RepID=UPI00059DF5CB|nr:carboxylesterase family protein [Saccharothrix espanaensis]